MKIGDIHVVVAEEQARARAMVAGLRHCPVKISRATTELGSFSVGRRDSSMEIKVTRHIATEEQLRETLRHEFAHQAAWERYRDLGHGPLWQTLATYLGCAPIACATYTVDPEVMAKRERYEVRCEACGWSVRRQRRSKLVDRPWRFSCARCNGTLRVSLLTASDREVP